ncbi:hypothetical protein KC338_g303 [Hortaea werneckii]|nr:hypothetical protein KC338_g303 [Hortaea werneckii]
MPNSQKPLTRTTALASATSNLPPVLSISLGGSPRYAVRISGNDPGGLYRGSASRIAISSGPIASAGYILGAVQMAPTAPLHPRPTYPTAPFRHRRVMPRKRRLPPMTWERRPRIGNVSPRQGFRWVAIGIGLGIRRDRAGQSEGGRSPWLQLRCRSGCPALLGSWVPPRLGSGPLLASGSLEDLISSSRLGVRD